MTTKPPSFNGSAIASVCSAVGLLLVASGCNLFDDLDGYSEETVADGGAGDAGAIKDAGGKPSPSAVPGCESAETLCLRLKSFSPHLTQRVGVDLVSEDGFLRSRAILDPFVDDDNDGKQDADIVLPLAIDKDEVPAKGDESTLHLEIFGDANEDGEYTESGGDHSWKEPLPASGHLEYPHNSRFTALKPRPQGAGGDFHMKFEKMGVHKGAMLEVFVIENATGRPVGFYRLQSIPGDNFEIVIPDIIDVGGVVYRIEFYADVNTNHAYDDPDVDHTWLIEFRESNDEGLNAEFTHGTDFAKLGYPGHPFKL